MRADLNTLCDLLDRNAELWPLRISHRWKTPQGFQEKSWSEFRDEVAVLALGLEASGVGAGSVALFADNRVEWAITDQALLHLGCPSVPRGSDTAPKEQKFIFLHSDARWLILEGAKNLVALAEEFGSDDRRPEKVFLMDDGGDLAGIPEAWLPLIGHYSALRAEGRTRLVSEPDALTRLRSNRTGDELVSIIYTSGTSGNPKGVMLTHNNFLHNVRAISPLLHVDPNAEECSVSVLPIWHVYERCFEFVAANCGMTLYYSSVRSLGEDLLRERPTIVASVPRVWESVYGKIRGKMDQESGAKRLIFGLLVGVARSRYRAGLALRGWRPLLEPHPWSWVGVPFHALAWVLLTPFNFVAQRAFAKLRKLLGGRLRASFSGGGSLPPQIDFFFNTIGISLVNAYGMTESAPGLITRRIERNVPGSIGIPLNEVEVRIVKEDGGLGEVGEKGLIHAKGPNVMKGYYKNPAATAEVVSADGWLNTGDLGALSYSGDYVITGRAKSTIVLVGGENVEPEPIEEKLQESDLIEHAVVVGQDQKSLRAILTVDQDHLKKLGDRLKVKWDELWHHEGETIQHGTVLDAMKAEIRRLVNRENGFKPFEAITKFVVLKKKFQVGDELTQKMSVKRKVVEAKYGHLLEDKDPKDPPTGD